MNEVNIMPGIDFKANKKRVREQIRKTKRKDKIESIVIGILLLVFVVGVLYLNKKMSDSALKSCQAKGNSYVYCINHI